MKHIPTARTPINFTCSPQLHLLYCEQRSLLTNIYGLHKRLDRASIMLRYSTAGIKEIAAAVGQGRIIPNRAGARRSAVNTAALAHRSVAIHDTIEQRAGIACHIDSAAPSVRSVIAENTGADLAVIVSAAASRLRAGRRSARHTSPTDGCALKSGIKQRAKEPVPQTPILMPITAVTF